MGIIRILKHIYFVKRLNEAISLGDAKVVEEYFLKIKPIFEEEILDANDDLKRNVYFSMGVASDILEKTNEAENYYIKALGYCRQNEKQSEKAFYVSNHRLGEMYYKQDKLKEARIYFFQALRISDTDNFDLPVNIPKLLRLLVNAYLYDRQYAGAEPFARRELALRTSYNLPTIDCENDLGIICLELKKYEEAKVLLTKTLLIREELHLKEYGVLKKVKDKVDENQQMLEMTLESLMDLYCFQPQNNELFKYCKKLKDFNPDSEVVTIENSLEEDLSSSESQKNQKIIPIQRLNRTIGRNENCFCGSGKKFKTCCMAN